MRLLGSTLLCFSCSLFLFANIAQAAPQEPPTAGAAEASSPPLPTATVNAPPSPDTVTAKQGPEAKRVAIALNPLALAIGRYSIQGEYLVSLHHAVTLNPFYTNAPVRVTVGSQEVDGGSLTGFGTELGYRYYSGRKGPEGFFVGPSLLFGSFSQSGATGISGRPATSDSFVAYGGAIDIGGQGIVGPGIVLGAGVGLQYTATSEDITTSNLNLASAIIAGGGLRPRFLLHAGFAF
jgi:hypothetical protein